MNGKPSAVALHQWTHDCGKVLLVKCVDADGRGFDGFEWPRSGKLTCPKAKADRMKATASNCKSGGLFGWPWAVSLGVGKEPDYTGRWIVFSANAEDVIEIDGKSKAIGEVEIVYYGDWNGALHFTLNGRIAWVQQNARGSASATGDRGSAALCGEHGVIEIAGKGSLGAVTATNWIWRIRSGAVVACRWLTDDGAATAKLLVADELGLADGELVQIRCGEIVKKDQIAQESV